MCDGLVVVFVCGFWPTNPSPPLTQLVFSSSCTVYGNPEYVPLDEKHRVKAVSPYGRTKLMIEEMLQDISAADPEWRIIALRYFNPVGAHSSGMMCVGCTC